MNLYYIYDYNSKPPGNQVHLENPHESVFLCNFRQWDIKMLNGGVCSIYLWVNRPTYERNIKAHRHFLDFYA